MWVPDEITKCVGFLCVKKDDGTSTEWIPKATCFFVSVPLGSVDGKMVSYLVTAKHNIIKIKGSGADLAIRVNNKAGQLVHVPIAKDAEWFSHPEHESDPADICLVTVQNRPDLDIKTLPIEMFLKQEDIINGEVVVGNDVFMTGLFTKLSGQKKIMPIVRTGSIAMLPENAERTKTSFGNVQAYLIEARSIGGLSGSPVFFYSSVVKNGAYRIGSIKFYFAGLIHGHWTVSKTEAKEMYVDSEENDSINMGIAIVTPAFKVLETLMRDELENQREKFEKDYEKASKAENQTG